jgi:hypothetical protein
MSSGEAGLLGEVMLGRRRLLTGEWWLCTEDGEPRWRGGWPPSGEDDGERVFFEELRLRFVCWIDTDDGRSCCMRCFMRLVAAEGDVQAFGEDDDDDNDDDDDEAVARLPVTGDEGCDAALVRLPELDLSPELELESRVVN